MVASALACIVGNLAYCLSYDLKSLPLLVIARLITGFGNHCPRRVSLCFRILASCGVWSAAQWFHFAFHPFRRGQHGVRQVKNFRRLRAGGEPTLYRDVRRAEGQDQCQRAFRQPQRGWHGARAAARAASFPRPGSETVW